MGFLKSLITTSHKPFAQKMLLLLERQREKIFSLRELHSKTAKLGIGEISPYNGNLKNVHTRHKKNKLNQCTKLPRLIYLNSNTGIQHIILHIVFQWVDGFFIIYISYCFYCSCNFYEEDLN